MVQSISVQAFLIAIPIKVHDNHFRHIRLEANCPRYNCKASTQLHEINKPSVNPLEIIMALLAPKCQKSFLLSCGPHQIFLVIGPIVNENVVH